MEGSTLGELFLYSLPPSMCTDTVHPQYPVTWLNPFLFTHQAIPQDQRTCMVLVTMDTELHWETSHQVDRLEQVLPPPHSPKRVRSRGLYGDVTAIFGSFHPYYLLVTQGDPCCQYMDTELH